MAIIRSANPFDQLSPAVKGLIIANLIVFVMQWILPPLFFEFMALRPILILKKYWIWQLVSYSFLHGGFLHLIINMFVLWMCGPHVEYAWGSRFFIQYYFLCVIGAAATQLILAPNSIVIGASGGIYGILLAFGLLFPDVIIYLFFIFPLRAIQAVFVLAIISLASAMGSGGDGIAHFAHLGGMATGFVVLKYPTWAEHFRLWRAARLFKNPKGRKRSFSSPDSNTADLSKEVDRILDKISAHGVDSLTPDEHKIMKKYADKKH